MNRWPDRALSGEEVVSLLDGPVHWRVEWCAGSSARPTSGFGRVLPQGVIERVPHSAKRRKFQRGINDQRTWIFATVSDDADRTDPDATLRAGLASSMLVGIVTGRRIIGVPTLVAAESENLNAIVGPTIQQILAPWQKATAQDRA